jgi:hypothetical protein
MRSCLRTFVWHLLLVVFTTGACYSQSLVSIRVVDENGVAVSDAQISIQQPGSEALQLRTDYLGRCRFSPASRNTYSARIAKPGFYVANFNDVELSDNQQFVVTHQQQIQQEINVVGSPPVIDPEQTSDASRMQTPEIINIPYPTSRDIRNLLPFSPGVVPDQFNDQVHVAGSETWQTQNLLEGFNITSPVNGLLSMRFSADAIRSIEVQTTRYPVEYGKASGGIIDFRSGMGDDRFRFNATNFIPSFQNKKGITFDKFVPRFTLSGPLKRGKAWFYDGLEFEYDNVIIPELPDGADDNRPWRGSNIAKFQVNIAPANILTFGGVVNLFRSPYDGISPLNPQATTARREITGGFAFIRDQQTFRDGTVLEAGIAGITFEDTFAPHGSGAYVVTPDRAQGSYFETSSGTSHRVQERVDLYVSPQKWAGRHVLKMGADVNQIHYGLDADRRPINYLRQDGTLLRQSTFPNAVDISGTNLEVGGYVEDAYSPTQRWLIEPGVRFDWDSLIGRGRFSPRIALTYSFGGDSLTKISAGIGLYYDHTQLELIERAQQSRLDTMFAPDGVTPAGPPVETVFVHRQGALDWPRTLNWSVGVERKLPYEIFFRANYVQKRGEDQFTFTRSLSPQGSDLYVLTNLRRDRYDAIEISARRAFAGGYSLFGSYVRSSATTNAALNYYPTLSILGIQGSGPLPWDAPNRVIAWGWLPFPKTKRLDFVFAMDWHSGYPFSSVTANQDLVGAPNSQRFPDYFSFSPGLEFRFRFRKTYFGLRGVAENITARRNPYAVNNVVDSPNYMSFLGSQGRAFTARIRIIGSN